MDRWANADMLMLPQRLRAQTISYVERGRPPSAFLTAVVTNDLKETFRHVYGADDAIALARLLQFLEAYVPGGAWGAPEKVTDWINRGGLKGPPRRPGAGQPLDFGGGR